MIQKLLRPKNATFCPGCSASLKLKEFNFDIKEPEYTNTQTTGGGKVISIKDAIHTKKQGKQVASLF